jgi:hypothetical protein
MSGLQVATPGHDHGAGAGNPHEVKGFSTLEPFEVRMANCISSRGWSRKGIIRGSA